MTRSNVFFPGAIALSFVLFSSPSSTASAAQPLVVCATVPDLGDLVREVGGEDVRVTTFAKGTEDPHFVEAKPSFVKALHEADLFVQVGMELELGWVPALLAQARNADVLPGASGHLDASTVIEPLGMPSAPVDRSMGDVHRLGNPHYLLSPRNGLAVAAEIRDRLAALRPERSDVFARRYEDFAARLEEALVGGDLAVEYDALKLAILFEAGKLASFLESRGDAHRLGGWLGAMMPHRGTRAVADHDLWPYFARAFALDVVAFLEPKPGIPPTTGHLREVIEQMRAERIPLILAAAYYDARHAALVERESDASTARMAHQVGALPGTDTYLETIARNVDAVVGALGSSR